MTGEHSRADLVVLSDQRLPRGYAGGAIHFEVSVSFFSHEHLQDLQHLLKGRVGTP